MTPNHHISNEVLLRRGRQRGFTLIELIVSMAAGLLISAAAFLLARNASAFFQHEARITSAQFASIVGMARLTDDVRRASYMSTPNVDADTRLCGTTGGWPAGMQQLAGVRVEQSGSTVRHPGDHALTILNGLTPDALIIAGMFDSTERFAAATITDSGTGGKDIYLNNDGAMYRALAKQTDGGTTLNQIFAEGRFIRVVDEEGRYAFGVIDSIDTGGAKVVVTTRGNPGLPTRDTANDVCGCAGFCRDALVNTISRVLYDLRTVAVLDYPQYAGLYAKSGHANPAFHKGEAEARRTELVRVELDADGAEIDTTLEVVSEYAVDLKFGITVEQTNQVGNAPVIERFPVGDIAVYTKAAALGGLNAGTPEELRAIQVRFSTRTAERDRDVSVPVAPSDGGLFRYSLGADRGFARMRTLVADIQLVNQQRRIDR